MTRHLVVGLFALALFLPGAAAAQQTQFSRFGIFGCNQDGAHAMSVGSLSAVGGIYVPVNDAAVTLNTGYLVYKECILRGVVNRQREAVTAETVRKVMVDFSTGRDGNPMWSVNIAVEERLVRDQSYLKSFSNGTLETLHPSFATQVKNAIVNTYAVNVNGASKKFECGYSGNLNAALNGLEYSPEALGHLMNPACNPYFAYQIANQHVASVAQYDTQALRTRLDRGRGIYDVVQYDQYGDPYVVTPAALVGGTAEYTLLSGYRQQESANDIDQMVGALFGGMSSHVVGDSRGLLGLTQQSGNQPSYLDQIVREAVTGLRTTAANVALVHVDRFLDIARRLQGILQQILSSMANAKDTLEEAERECYEKIIENVCANGEINSQKRCTATSGEQLQIATSTFKSEEALSALLGSQAGQTQQDLSRVGTAIQRLTQIRSGVTNVATPAAQASAIEQVNNLSRDGTIPSEAQVTAAQNRLTVVQSRLSGSESDLVEILTDWTTHDEPEVGWCNTDNEELLDEWKEEWRI